LRACLLEHALEKAIDRSPPSPVALACAEMSRKGLAARVPPRTIAR
jgi:hypothetical protein